MVAAAGKVITGILEAMQAGYRADPDAAFAPLSAWLSRSNWGGVGRGVGLRKAPQSLLDVQGNPSPYLADNAPFITSQAEAIGPQLRYDMLTEATRLEEKRRIALMSLAEKEDYARLWGNNFNAPYRTSYDDASVEELLEILASKDYATKSLGHDPRWFEDEFMYNNWARAHDQIMTFSDALRSYDFSRMSRNFDNPYYGRVGNFLPRSEFVRNPPQSPFTINDIPF